MSEFFDREGNPIDLKAWTQLYDDENYRVIGRTTMDDGAWVSTVWLGVNHGVPWGPLVIFETMVFGVENQALEICERYSTLEEAIEGHRRIVAMVIDYKQDVF